MERQTGDRSVVSFENFQTLSRWNMPDTNARICTASDGDLLSKRTDSIRRRIALDFFYFVEMMNDMRHFLLMTLECGNHLFTVFVKDNRLSIVAA